jgi:hypothetical protein
VGTGLIVLIVVGIVLVLAAGAVFYVVGRSEDRERAREARTARPPADPVRARRRRPSRRRDHE